MLQSKDIGYQSGLRKQDPGRLGGSGVEPLPSTRGVILESGIESHIGLLVGSLLLSLPNFLPPPQIKSLFKKQDPSVCCLQDAHLRPIDTSRLKVRGWKIIYHANGQQKKAGGPILISDKLDVKPNTGDTWWLSGWAYAFGSGRDPGVQGLSPISGSPQGARFSLCLCLYLPLCVTHE